MRYISIVAASIISVFFQVRSGKALKYKDIVGTWVNSGGAAVVLLENGNFRPNHFVPNMSFFPKIVLGIKDLMGMENGLLEKGKPSGKYI